MVLKKADTGFPLAWSLLTQAVSSARLDVHNIRHMAERWCALADSSPHKDALYGEAGDVIVSLPKAIQDLETTLDALGYALSALGHKQLRDRLPIDTRFRVDRALADARLPMTVDESNPILPLKKSSRRRADLNPPLGNPGGPCHVLRRIRNEVSNPRLQNALVREYEIDGELDNAEASQVYDIEPGGTPSSSFIKQVLITAHAQFRMDQRSITVKDVQQAMQEFTRTYSNWKSDPRSRFRTDKWDADLAFGNKIVYDARNITVVFAASKFGGRGVVDLITVYSQGASNPRPLPEAACRVS